MQIVFPESAALEASEPIEMSSQLFSVYHACVVNQREKPLPAVRPKVPFSAMTSLIVVIFLSWVFMTPGSFDMTYN